MKEHLFPLAIELLQQLISIPSYSKEENKTASLIENFFKHYKIETVRKGNNVWAKNKFFDAAKPTLLLNSHHDTVKPNPAYTRDPFDASMADGKLYGLGSNDAGGPLVSLLMTFFYFYAENDLKYNIEIVSYFHGQWKYFMYTISFQIWVRMRQKRKQLVTQNLC